VEDCVEDAEQRGVDHESSEASPESAWAQTRDPSEYKYGYSNYDAAVRDEEVNGGVSGPLGPQVRREESHPCACDPGEVTELDGPRREGEARDDRHPDGDVA
jgi:hypothetical protein